MSNFVLHGMRLFARVVGSRVVWGALIAVCLLSVSPALAGPFSIAKRYVGLHEKTHTKQLAGTLGVNPRRTPWCGAFVGAVMKRAGKSVPNGYNARC